jgi:hypothetical protein
MASRMGRKTAAHCKIVLVATDAHIKTSSKCALYRRPLAVARVASLDAYLRNSVPPRRCGIARDGLYWLSCPSGVGDDDRL